MTYEDFLSQERLSKFRITDQDSKEKILSRYLWNLELCSTFYVPLHLLEVGIRNSVDQSLSKEFGENWLFEPGILGSRESESVAKALKELNKRNEKQIKGKVIAELMFGFWVSLFYKNYENSPILRTTNQNEIFWPKCIKSVFPNAPKSMQTRKAMSARLEDIKRLRNRVFHHESLIIVSDLYMVHNEICEVIKWISDDVDVLFICDRVKDVIAKRPL